jgi:Methyltransferase domain
LRRTVEAEWLDALPAQDPAALGSRRDLDVLNRLMGHGAILRGLLNSRVNSNPPKRIVELGAGDGTLLLRLSKHLAAKWTGVEVLLLDSKPAATQDTLAAYGKLGWTARPIVKDVFAWLEEGNEMADIMLANLFLHQFSDKDLAKLLALASARTRLFVACEPRRARFPYVFSKLLGFIGCNRVTRHDAPLSVRAGFAGKELSALWPAGRDWRVQERPAHFFSHAFLAERTGDSH